MTRGVHTTGLYYNKAILDQAGLEPPKTIADLKAMVKPLAALGAAPLVHCSGDVVLQPVARHVGAAHDRRERSGDPLAFVESTIRGDVGYDSPEWIEAFQTIADLRTSGVLLEGSGATDYATMQQLLLQGKAAMTYNGTWLLPQLQAGHADRSRSTCTWRRCPSSTGRPEARLDPCLGRFRAAGQGRGDRDSVYAFLEYASRPDVDKAVVEGCQSYSPIAGSNAGIHDPVAREFLPMLDDAITSLNWLWEPEIDAEIGNQVQALVKGDTDAGFRREGDRGRRRWTAFVRSQLLLVSIGRPALCSRPSSMRPTAAPERGAAAARLDARGSTAGRSRRSRSSRRRPGSASRRWWPSGWRRSSQRPAGRVALARPGRQRPGVLLDVRDRRAADASPRTSATACCPSSTRRDRPTRRVVATLLNELSAHDERRRARARRLPRHRRAARSTRAWRSCSTTCRRRCTW